MCGKKRTLGRKMRIEPLLYISHAGICHERVFRSKRKILIWRIMTKRFISPFIEWRRSLGNRTVNKQMTRIHTGLEELLSQRNIVKRTGRSSRLEELGKLWVKNRGVRRPSYTGWTKCRGFSKNGLHKEWRSNYEDVA